MVNITKRNQSLNITNKLKENKYTKFMLQKLPSYNTLVITRDIVFIIIFDILEMENHLFSHIHIFLFAIIVRYF